MNRNMKVQELILYRNFDRSEILKDIVWIMEHYDDAPAGLASAAAEQLEEMQALLYEGVNGIVELAGDYGFRGNLWHTYLTFLLVNHENAYSRACEVVGEVPGSLNQLVANDFEIFRTLFHFDFSAVEEALQVDCFRLITDFENISSRRKLFNKRIRDRICELAVKLAAAEDAAVFKADVTEFYREFGVGKLGLHKAFRVEQKENRTEIVPITNITHVHLDELIGYDIPKRKLVENTEAFLDGKRANNCLLFGDAGTGKSTSIKAILNQYYDRGLRMIEVYKHQFKALNDVIAQIKNRNYKFIIYMDDLSFEDFEIDYKYLKAVIEGGLEKKPGNVLIYATSNRRHLIREDFADKEGTRGDLHTSDTVQEKLSLAARFGVSIYFGGPSQKEFNHIVDELAKKHHITMEEDELLRLANQWELSHGGRSGRTAQQFIDYLAGVR